MPHPALVEAIRRRAADEVAALWQQAHADAEAVRAERARAIDATRVRARQALAAEAAERRRTARATADVEARRIRADMKAALSARLHAAAAAALPRVRARAGDTLFDALARELPDRPWQHVTVNPADRAAAQARFPNAAIAVDAGIAGGLIAEGSGLRVDNTLERRLENAWPDLLPALMAEALEAAGA